MKCSQIREWILLDREDGVLSAEKEAILKEHLEKCSACRELADTLDHKQIFAFQPGEKTLPREEVWQTIKETLTSGQRESLMDIIADDIRNFFMIRKKAIAVAIVALMIAGAGITGRMTLVARNAEEFLSNQALFMSSFAEEDMFSEATGLSAWDI